MERTKKDTKELLIQFKKIGGGSFRLKGGKIIKPNQVFFALPTDIPEAFLDAVKPVDGTNISKESVPKVLPVEVAPAAYSIEPGSVGWFNVVDGEGKPMNEKALRKDAADELLAELLAE